MTVREAVAELLKQNQDLDLVIEQGEEFNYMLAQSVKETEMFSEDNDTEEPIQVVVISYT